MIIFHNDTIGSGIPGSSVLHFCNVEAGVPYSFKLQFTILYAWRCGIKIR